MKVTLESTDKVVTLHAGADGDVPARISRELRARLQQSVRI